MFLNYMSRFKIRTSDQIFQLTDDKIDIALRSGRAGCHADLAVWLQFVSLPVSRIRNEKSRLAAAFADLGQTVAVGAAYAAYRLIVTLIL